MDDNRFDDVIRAFAASRRSLLGGTLAAAVALGSATVEARKKRKGRKKRGAKPNKFGCLDVGQKCDGKDGRCCSGICEGTGAASRCVAHNELGCEAETATCSEFVACGTDGSCFLTTGKAAFCADYNTCDCTPCKKDTDCEGRFGPGAACIVCADCNGVNGAKGTACVPPAV